MENKKFDKINNCNCTSKISEETDDSLFFNTAYIAGLYGMSEKEFYRYLFSYGICYSYNFSWYLNDKYINKGYIPGNFEPGKRQRANLWTMPGIQMIMNELNKHGMYPVQIFTK